MGRPAWWRSRAAESVPSPPATIRASRPNRLTLDSSRWRSSTLRSGLTREVPRIVPPLGRMPMTEYDVRGSTSPSMRPSQPLRMPRTSIPRPWARRTTARITALRPGQSPPPVRTPTFFMATIGKYKLPGFRTAALRKEASLRVLAVDTTTARESVALAEGGAVRGEIRLSLVDGHSRHPMPSIAFLLEVLGLAPGDVEGYAVAAGPGSFTGLRVGIGAVQGLALAADRPCAAVSA